MKYFCFLLVLLLASCHKEAIPTAPNPPTRDTLQTDFRLVWRTPLASDTSFRDTQGPYIGDGLIYWIDRDVNLNLDHVNCADLSGTRLWRYRSTGAVSVASGVALSGARLFTTTWNTVTAYDRSGRLWENTISFGVGSPHISVVGNYLYHENSLSASLDSVSYLVRMSIDFGKSDTIFTLKSTDGYSPDLCSVSGKDDLLVFQDRSWNPHDQKGRVTLYGTDFDGDLRWKTVLPAQNSNIVQPIFWLGDRFGFFGDKSLFFVSKDGKILNQKTVKNEGDHTVVAAAAVVGDDALVKTSREESLHRIDKNGGTIWSLQGVGTSTQRIEVVGDYAFFTSKSTGFVYIVRCSDGTLLKTLKGAYRGVSADGRNVYVSDGLYLSCFAF